MRFVDDGILTFGNHFTVRALPNGGIGAEQVMIDDNQLRLGGTLTHFRDETVLIARALGAYAVFRCCGNLTPKRQVLRKVGDLRAVAGICAGRPLFDDWQKDLRRGFAEQPGLFACRVSERIEPMKAQEISSTFHVGRGERNTERLAKNRKVLEINLLLEVLCAGGKQHALTAQNRGD